MKHLILLTILSLILTACSSNSAPTSATPDNNNSKNTGTDTRIESPPVAYAGYDSFGAVADKTLNLPSLAVQQTGTNTAGNPITTLSFDVDGNIASASLYIDGKKYDAPADNINRDFADTATNNFTANYMVNSYLSIGEFNGLVIAGFQTEGAHIPTQQSTIFTGAGVGRTLVDDVDESVEFNVTADVDFVAFTVAFSATGTACDSGCTLPNLNIPETTLTYTAGTNAISGELTNIDDMNGTANARFYGGDASNSAWEFGGTFALKNATNYYYGAFGGQRTGITYNTDFSNQANPFQHTQTISDYANIYAALTAADTITMNAFGVYGDSQIDHVRLPHIASLADGDKTASNRITRLSGAAASLTFDGSVATGVTLYLDNATYSATDSNGTASGLTATISDATDTSTATLNMSRGAGINAVFGFTSSYLAYIDWAIEKTGIDNNALIDETYAIKGMMVAGIETIDARIINAIGETGEVVFTGKGRGYERDNDDNSLKYISFTATATVDFASNATVTLASTLNQICDDAFANCGVADAETKYNFTSNALAFTDNNISGAITNTDGVATGYTGVADARFYSGRAEELAGSFAMNDNDNNHYYGVFGGKRSAYFAPLDKPTSFNANGLVSFDDTNRKGTQNNTLKTRFVEITRTTAGVVTTKIDNDGVVEFDYDGDGYFGGTNDDPVIFYFADKTHKITSRSSTDDQFINLIAVSAPENEPYLYSSDGIKPSLISLDRSTAVFTNFQAQYMAVATWWVLPAPADAPADTTLPDIDYKSYGFGITGFETAGTSLPNADISFTGRGYGRYGDDGAIIGTSFNVTANVDVANRTVTVESNTTCTNGTDNTTCSNTLRPDLEFTATLGYAENINALTSNNFATAGDGVGGSNPSLTGGTVEARFYGPNTEEIGGTFNASNATSAYIGFFGAQQ